MRVARQSAIDHDRAVIRTALREELRAIKSAFTNRIETLLEAEDDNTQQMLVPIGSLITIYDRLVDRLGLLTAEEVRLVLRAYLVAREFPEKLRLLSLQMPDDKRGYLIVERKHFKALKQLHLGGLGVLDEAIGVISVPKA